MVEQKQRILNQFETLERAIIDTSSLIYLSKIDLLNLTADTIYLLTVPGVIKESGVAEWLKHIEVMDIVNPSSIHTTTDQCIIKMADYLKIPVISEDKKVLMSAKRAGLTYFNSLMILNFLLYKELIQKDFYEQTLIRLKQSAYYTEDVYCFGKMVYKWIMEKAREE